MAKRRRSSSDKTPNKLKSSASKFGQIIGKTLEAAVIKLITEYLEEAHDDYELLAPKQGTMQITLPMLGGSTRQIDAAIAPKDSSDPVALIETKWLKDGRHHDDKGAWILQLREIKRRLSTVRATLAILAGYWTDALVLLLVSEGEVTAIKVATDEQVYETLQTPLNDHYGDKTVTLDASKMRESYPEPDKLAEFIIAIRDSGELENIASKWLEFKSVKDGKKVTGADQVRRAIDKILEPLPANPTITKYEITLGISTGNAIHSDFNDYEGLRDFIEGFLSDPTQILEQIQPKKALRQGQSYRKGKSRSKKVKESWSLFELDS